MTLHNNLKKVKTEEDIKHTYIKALGLIDIQSISQKKSSYAVF